MQPLLFLITLYIHPHPLCYSYLSWLLPVLCYRLQVTIFYPQSAKTLARPWQMLYLTFLAPDGISTAFAHTHVYLIHKTFSRAHRPAPVFPVLQNVASAERMNTIKFIERVNAEMEVFPSLLAKVY